VDWVFVYTREAHPGEHVPAHADLEDKLRAARLLRDELGIRRRILVDGLDGPAHHAFGLLPNMTYVVDRGGRVVFKADWTDAANVESFLTRYLAARADRQPGRRLAPYLTQQAEYRAVDDDAFRARLEINGPRAVTEWDAAVAIWRSRG